MQYTNDSIIIILIIVVVLDIIIIIINVRFSKFSSFLELKKRVHISAYCLEKMSRTIATSQALEEVEFTGEANCLGAMGNISVLILKKGITTSVTESRVH